jgi:hypothetical protein
VADTHDRSTKKEYLNDRLDVGTKEEDDGDENEIKI